MLRERYTTAIRRVIGTGILCALICFVVAGGAPSVRAQTAANQSPPAMPTTLNIVLHDQAPYFNPKRVRVGRGSTVVWNNQGPALVHTILINSTKGAVRSGSIRPGQTWSYTFTEAEDAVIKTSCEVHPYMYGMIIVGNPPDALVSAMESTVGSASGGALARILEFPLPVPNSVPGIIAIDSDDNIWFTMGGGGFANINYPPLSKIGRLTIDGDVTVYTLPTPAAGPSGIAISPDGIVFVTELFGNKIARLDPSRHLIEEYPIPTPESWPTGLVLDAEGNLWFNETKGNKIGRLSAAGVITEFDVPTSASRSTGMAIDQQGNIWIAEREASKIGCLRRDRTFVEYSLPRPGARPTGITVDDRGRVWFAERAGNAIGVLEDGQVREYPLPNAQSAPFFPVVDRDGKVWVTEMFGNRVQMLDPLSGKTVEYAIPTPDSWPLGMAFDSQGNIWVAEQLGNKVAVMLAGQEAKPKDVPQKRAEQ